MTRSIARFGIGYRDRPHAGSVCNSELAAGRGDLDGAFHVRTKVLSVWLLLLLLCLQSWAEAAVTTEPSG